MKVKNYDNGVEHVNVKWHPCYKTKNARIVKLDSHKSIILQPNKIGFAVSES